jgi:hypothetical protein
MKNKAKYTLLEQFQNPTDLISIDSDRVCQLLAHGRWFSPGTPASSTTKTARHDIAEILLKVALNTKKQINRNQICWILELFQQCIFCFVFHVIRFTCTLFDILENHRPWASNWQTLSLAVAS